jgi:16S rRNA (adenine1518-N6/adenine1519-N6)-dimethyltransferase
LTDKPDEPTNLGVEARPNPVGLGNPLALLPETPPISPKPQEEISPKAQLRALGLTPKKSWGQNFLHNESVLRSIANTAAKPGEVVLEIGAGLGHLTRKLLANQTKVSAIERDRDMVAALRLSFADENNLTILEDNALTFDFVAFATSHKTIPSIVGNLPYHITSPILFRILEVIERFSRVVLMVQKEVCDRIVAAPGSDDYSALSALVSARAKPQRLMQVSREAFYPIPNVDSAVFQLTPLGGVDAAFWNGPYRDMVNASFHARRKTIWNNLRSVYPPEKVTQALQELSIDPTRRAETLRPDEFWSLAEKLQLIPGE